jgi:hypothetical protein
VFFLNFGVLVIFRQQNVVKRGVLITPATMQNLRRICSQNMRRIGKSLAQNFENVGAESQEAYYRPNLFMKSIISFMRYFVAA